MGCTPASRRNRAGTLTAVTSDKREIHLTRTAGAGDVLLCTPALRELRRLAPDARIVFHTRYPSLVAGLPYIDEVRPCENPPAGSIFMGYENVKSPNVHLAKVIAANLGFQISDVRPDCSVNTTLVAQYREAWSHLPAPYVAVQRKAGPWTPNKNWPDDNWELLIDELTRSATVIEIGDLGEPAQARFGAYLDLRGKTSLESLVAVIAAADILVGPISGPAHIAAAVGTPSVRIIGGYESPECTAYDGSLSLFTPTECAPCWLREPCTFGRKCLSAIAPSVVVSAIANLLTPKSAPASPMRA